MKRPAFLLGEIMEELIFCEVDIDEMKATSKSLVENLLGRKLQESDPLILFLYSLLSIIAQQRAIINDSAQQNLLAYARSKNLEALGDLVGVERQPAKASTCTVEVSLTTSRNKETVISAGTRFSAGDNVYFALTEDVIFLAGETVKTASAQCLEVGEVGNNYKIGELNNITDLRPFLKSIKNVTMSEGGADIEDDDSLRERIRVAPESFSTAGPRGSYEFHCKDYNTAIIDSYVTSPRPGYVDVYFLMEGGQIPGEEMLAGVLEHLSSERLRPLTDFVEVFPPEIVNYNIDLKYWISRENKTHAATIIENVEKAVQDFILWQKSKIGRDISQTELFYKLRAAGADRVEIVQPVFTEIADNAVAICENVNVEYKGLKDI